MNEYTQPDMIKLISRLYRKSHMYLNERLKEFDLTSGLAPFVIITCRRGKMPQNGFCEELDIDKSTVTKVIAKLEELEYVERCPNASDSRSVDVYPTAKAIKHYPLLIEIGDDYVKEVTRGMTEIERNIFITLLDQAGQNASSFFDTPRD